ncbi:hypothetical protein AB0N09_05060 [Streptomyces erythrochromogenes]|uniref:hypothetical protein n=1 Tax=Streptomyces erythrochromogenes TaxID=285574 RepID=UPI003419EEF5
MTGFLSLLLKLVEPLARRGLPCLALAVLALAGCGAALAASVAVLAAGQGLLAVLQHLDAGTGTVLLQGAMTVAAVVGALLGMGAKAGLIVLSVLTPCAAAVDVAARRRAGAHRPTARRNRS